MYANQLLFKQLASLPDVNTPSSKLVRMIKLEMGNVFVLVVNRMNASAVDDFGDKTYEVFYGNRAENRCIRF